MSISDFCNILSEDYRPGELRSSTQKVRITGILQLLGSRDVAKKYSYRARFPVLNNIMEATSPGILFCNIPNPLTHPIN